MYLEWIQSDVKWFESNEKFIENFQSLMEVMSDDEELEIVHDTNDTFDSQTITTARSKQTNDSSKGA